MSPPKGKGKAKQRAKGPPTSSSPPNPSPSRAPPPPPRPSVSSSPASSSTSTPLPPPSMPKRRFLRRILPLLLTANFAVGAYVLLSNQKKRQAEKDEVAAVEGPAASVVSTNTTVPEETLLKEHIPSPVKVLPPIP